MGAARGRGEVAGGGEGGGGHEVAVAQPGGYGQAAQGAGEVAGGEGVAGADRGDDVHAGRGLGMAYAMFVVGDRAVGAALDDERRGFGKGGADGVRAAGDAPGVLGLVLADEDEVGAAGQVEQDAGVVGAGPQAGAVVDVEGDEGRPAGVRAVRSAVRSRQPAESAGVIPDRCRTRPERIAARSMFWLVIAEAADPAR